MGHDAGDSAGIAAAAGSVVAPAWDRFAHWPPLRARLGLLALVLLLVASALVPIGERADKVATKSFIENLNQAQGAPGAKEIRDHRAFTFLWKTI